MTAVSKPWLLGALALTVLACAWLSSSEPAEAVTTATPRHPQRPAPAAAADAPAPRDEGLPELVRAEPLPWPKPQTAAVAAWGVPPPAPAPPPVPASPAPPATPPQPQAPPFPYQLIGRLLQGEHTQALMTGPVRTVAVRAGEVVDGQWRIDQVEATAVSVTWLPGAQAQRIGYQAPP